jgi:hypothetical protein
VSTLSKGSIISSNVIINPGTYNYYEHLHTSFKGIDSYVMLPDSAADVLVCNNYFSRNPNGAGFEPSGYALLEHSPLIDAGNNDLKGIAFDAYRNPRVYGNSPDIGAIEFNPKYSSVYNREKDFEIKPVLFPNPVKTMLSINFCSSEESIITLGIYNLNGRREMSAQVLSEKDKECSIAINVETLKPGVYIYQLGTLQYKVSGKFIKVD